MRTGFSGSEETLLGRGAEFNGTLTFKDSVRIEGKLTGEISSDGTLIIGEGGEVQAEIKVDTVIIQGRLVGNVQAKSAVELLATGFLKGNVTTVSLNIHKGAIFNGTSSMPEGPITAQPPVQTSTLPDL
ncbi:MAG TPA: polymer-forming cytoskeletal protein [Myxococcota bacterium]|nr:polymer-forming cytoskeletal protein [Myxococcota bacterium]HQI62216.1 polymer-forming cytoskeletal protein [Myxococcota bacterium]